MKPLPRYVDDTGIIHVCAPAWSRYGLACRRLDVKGISPVELSTPLTCVWCATDTSTRYEDTMDAGWAIPQ